MIETFTARIPLCGSVNFEDRAFLSKHFIENSVDPVTGQPYFDVFYGTPVSFYHDWPDFGDLVARYWEACYMIQDITGEFPANTGKLRELLFSYFGEDGLSYRPASSYSTNSAELFDQGRTLSALCSVYAASGDEEVARAMQKMVDGLNTIAEVNDGYRYMPGSRYAHGEWESRASNCGYFVGPLIRPLVKAWDLLQYQPALDLAGDLARYVVEKAEVFGPNGEFDDHVHSRLATAAGLLTCGQALGHSDWKRVAARAWDYARIFSGQCGFVPEYLGYYGTQLRSETCAIMDYLDLTILLAVDGDDSKWGEAERIVRNHLIESQSTCSDWAPSAPANPRDDLSLGEGVPGRMLGGFAGWCGFDSYFGMTPYHGPGWALTEESKDIYSQHPRLFQNCCGPAGLRALYLAWSQTAAIDGEDLRVNMLLNRSLPHGSVKVAEGAAGTIDISVNVECLTNLSLRIPKWVNIALMSVTRNGKYVQLDIAGGRLKMRGLQAGETILVRMPYVLTEEFYRIQHGSYLHEEFSITFKGDAAVRVQRICGGLSKEEKNKASVLADAYPLYNRASGSVYAPEKEPRSVEASINWF